MTEQRAKRINKRLSIWDIGIFHSTWLELDLYILLIIYITFISYFQDVFDIKPEPGTGATLVVSRPADQQQLHAPRHASPPMLGSGGSVDPPLSPSCRLGGDRPAAQTGEGG